MWHHLTRARDISLRSLVVVASLSVTFVAGCGSTSLLVPQPSACLLLNDSREYPLPATSHRPSDVAIGWDGNLWFTESGPPEIGRYNLQTGVVMDFKVPSGGQPENIVAGPDGNLWFTEPTGDRIGQINPRTFQIHEISLPTGSGPTGITVGPAGDLWVTDQTSNDIRWINLNPGTGGVVPLGASYSVPAGGSGPHSITAGPNDTLWFTLLHGNGIGRVQLTTTAPPAITTFPVPPIGNLIFPFNIITAYGKLWFTNNFALGGIGEIDPTTTPPTFNAFFMTPRGQVFDTEPWGIALGPDGNLWYTESGPNGNRIGRLSPSTGTITEFPVSTANSVPQGIVAGPNGNLWFTEFSGNRLGEIHAGRITEFPVPTPGGTGRIFPTSITLGPDGNMWFTEQGTGPLAPDAIGKVDLTTAPPTITAFSNGVTFGSQPLGIAAGGGYLWFTEFSGNRIGRVDPRTSPPTITEYNVPTLNSDPSDITAGPGGDLWFTELAGDRIGRIDPTTNPPTITDNFPVPTINGGPDGIASDAFGHLWFTENGAGKIGRVDTTTTTPTITDYPVSARFSNPREISAGPGGYGDLWFTGDTIFLGLVFPAAHITITDYLVQGGGGPNYITAGPDGNMWFTLIAPAGIGWFAPTTPPAINHMPVPTAGSGPGGISAGPHCTVWFTEASSGNIGEIS